MPLKVTYTLAVIEESDADWPARKCLTEQRVQQSLAGLPPEAHHIRLVRVQYLDSPAAWHYLTASPRCHLAYLESGQAAQEAVPPGPGIGLEPWAAQV